MKRLIFTVALAVVASDARADWGNGPAAIPPQAAGARTSGSGGPGTYGVNPAMKRLMWWKKDAGCSTCGQAGMGGPAGGTLVYPQHQFARSPRDWFMFGY